MPLSLPELQARVQSQKTLIPSLYGDIDFSLTPERFTDDPAVESMLPGRFARKYRAGVLADRERVERARAYTMLGDIVADSYAALMPQYGFRRLIAMLTEACDHGVDKVADAPPELVAFIREMERVPDWLDMELVNEGARNGRIYMASMVPFAIRGAFIATFMNKYSGLPMALTGTLTDESSVQRVKETASFFTTATLPGALQRYGAGFKAAAMVRLMHSMVRFNILKRSKKWDVKVYGIPVPQVDQMPAGTMVAFITAFKAVRARREFTRAERAAVELWPLPELPARPARGPAAVSPRGIFDAMLTYAATLRDGYDDDTNGALVRSTMGAYLPPDDSLPNKVFDTFERGFAKVFFTHTFQVKPKKARQMGVKPDPRDYLLFAASNLFILPQVTAHQIAARIPVLDGIADRLLISRINDLLVGYGHAEYTTDPDKYREAARA